MRHITNIWITVASKTIFIFTPATLGSINEINTNKIYAYIISETVELCFYSWLPKVTNTVTQFHVFGCARQFSFFSALISLKGIGRGIVVSSHKHQHRIQRTLSYQSCALARERSTAHSCLVFLRNFFLFSLEGSSLVASQVASLWLNKKSLTFIQLKSNVPLNRFN